MSYMVLVIDTTGLQKDDRVTRIRYLVADGDELVGAGDEHLNLLVPDSPVPRAWLQRRLQGQPGHRRLCLESLASARDPRAILRETVDRIEGLGPNGLIVGHGLLSLSWRTLARDVQLWLGRELPGATVWDTGLVHKAITARLTPWPEEDLNTFLVRVGQHRVSGRWSLDHCIQLLDLDTGLPPDQPFLRVRAIEELYRFQRATIESWRHSSVPHTAALCGLLASYRVGHAVELCAAGRD